ncbi:capZ-interacting protein [Hoplias malabaricus]|uniref:capZ-interacting protein n=1 Tax=Hoplias malabaricus TaxID=27720 RepID=UPI00346225B0
MEEASPVKVSVAEMAGKFKGHVLPKPMNEEKNPAKSPPCSLELHNQTDAESEQEKPAVPSHLPKGKLKSSPLIEKLQANLAFTPTTLISTPKSPEVKQRSSPLCPLGPCDSLSPTLRPHQLNTEEELPVSFEQPAEGTPLHNINKSRVRLSFNRRPPTRQHRKSAGEEVVADSHERNTSPHSPEKNGEVFSAPQEEKAEDLKDVIVMTDQDTEPQEGDSQENGGNNVIQVVIEEVVTGDKGSEQLQDTNLVETQQEEKPSEKQSPEQMEGVEEGGTLLPTEGDEEIKVLEQIV